MKLEPNMYFRTEDGKIGKIIKVINEHYVSANILTVKNWPTLTNGITKTSTNIIDLIKLGDYVNGYLVTTISEDAYGKMVCVGQRLSEKSGYYKTYYNEKIKTVVTKEQFERSTYKVD